MTNEDKHFLYWETIQNIPRESLCEALSKITSLLEASPLFTNTLDLNICEDTGNPMLTHIIDESNLQSQWAIGMGIDLLQSVWGGLSTNGSGASTINEHQGFIPLLILGYIYKHYFCEYISLTLDGERPLTRLLYKDIISICPDYHTADNYELACLVGLSFKPLLTTINSKTVFAF